MTNPVLDFALSNIILLGIIWWLFRTGEGKKLVKKAKQWIEKGEIK